MPINEFCLRVEIDGLNLQRLHTGEGGIRSHYFSLRHSTDKIVSGRPEWLVPAVVARTSYKWLRRAPPSGNVSIAGRFDLLANAAIGVAFVLVGVAAVASLMLMPVQNKIAPSAFSTSFFLVGGVIKGYAAAMGNAEQSVSYELMGALSRNARTPLERNTGNAAIEKHCLFSLGKFALDENASWLLMHRKNAFRVSA